MAFEGLCRMFRVGVVLVAAVFLPKGVSSQAPAGGQLPPMDSPPLVRYIEIAFPAQGNISVIDPQTYQFYIHTLPSRPSVGVWEPYDERTVLADFYRLWETKFLDDLWIDVKDVPYENGVVGKHVTFNLEERQRIKIVEYVGSDALKQSDIEEKLVENSSLIRLDSFIEPSLISTIEGILRGMLSEAGYQYADVTHEIQEVAGGPKLVNISFHLNEGPKVKIREIDFVGNVALKDGALKKQMENNKEEWFLSFISGRGIYQEEKFEADADKVVQYYREHGYITAQVGQPELVSPVDFDEGKTRKVTLRIPVTEGERYRVGEFSFDGNEVIPDRLLIPMFDVTPGEFYNEKKVRDTLEKLQEMYGAGGYFEFTGFPDLRPRDRGVAVNDDTDDKPGSRQFPSDTKIVDVTMRFQEGEKYFVNRISFEGNTLTRDSVIRRNMRLFENGAFSTEGLKDSVLSLNQMGFFEPIEQGAVDIQPTPGEENKLDVKLTVREQNRNQLSFGAGVSQFEGFFGQMSFQTANFLGRGESLTLSGQAGSRYKNYQTSFTDPYMFDRPITGGIDLYKRDMMFPYQFTQSSLGGTLIMGFRATTFTQIFTNYSYEQVQVKELNELFFNPQTLAMNPYLADSLLLGKGGQRTVSKISPNIVYNTVDHPIFPSTGTKLNVQFQLAGLGGNTAFWSPRLEAVQYFKITDKMSFGFRARYAYIKPYRGTVELPIFEKLFLGGELSVRGFDMRSIGPRDSISGLVLGGDKSLLLNGEYLISIGGPIRLVMFYDTGQVRDRDQKFRMNEFKTSAGLELRFFMPVLNVPFRLIFAHNPQRSGVLDNNFEPAKSFVFRFAIGTTF